MIIFLGCIQQNSYILPICTVYSWHRLLAIFPLCWQLASP